MEKEPTPGTQKARPSITSMKTNPIIISPLMVVLEKEFNRLHSLSGNPTLSLSTYDDTQFHELDKINIGQLGRQWFGEKFDINNEQEFDFDFPNIDATVPIKISTETASQPLPQHPSWFLQITPLLQP